jgi:methyltransferase-like protein
MIEQVAAAQAKIAAAAAGKNTARASNYAAFLAGRQARNLAIQRTRVANNPNLTPAQKTNAINAFIARQQTIANNSQQNQQAISNVNNNAVAVQGQALQVILTLFLVSIQLRTRFDLILYCSLNHSFVLLKS